MADLSDQEFGLQSDEQFMGGSSPSEMSDKEFGLQSDEEFMGSPKPQAEGPIASNVRAAAHGIIPAGGAAVGIGAGAAIGAPAGPVGAIVGGFIGGVLGGMGGDVIQDKAQAAIPAIDDRPQMQADEEAYPLSTTISRMAPMAGAPGKLAGSLAQRVGSAGLMGTLEAGDEAYHTGHIDPAKVAAVGAFGAAFPHGNKVTNAISDRVTGAVSGAVSRFVPGRPGRAPNPDPAAQQSHADVGDNTPETSVGDWAESQMPPSPTGETVGTPDENKPTNSKGEVATGEADGSYAKTTPASDTSQVTTGDMDPATSAALAATQPAAKPPVQRPLGMPQENYQPPKQPQGEAAPVEDVGNNPALPTEGNKPPEPVVDTGIPQEGQPVAVGENEATPMPQREMPDLHEAMKGLAAPDISGSTAQPTEGQAKAGNYLKARTKDFGKPIAIETRAGEMRKGPGWEHESPYDYGYFNQTKSTDKDNIDFVRPKEGSPEFGDKHFIVDQKNAETGKYDEPKVFTYLKDEAAARDLYNRGFGDGKGPDRMHDITEVTRPDLVKYLLKHTTKPPTKPYGKPMPPAVKPVAERAAVKDAIQKFEAKGDKAKADMLRNAPDAALEAIAGKRTRKYGVETGASAGYPVEGLLNSEGKPVTANTKAKADQRSAAHKKVTDWFDESKPPSQMDPDKESNGELLDRIKSHPFPKSGDWAPTFKTKEWMLAKAARDAVAKPTPGNIAKYRDAERLLRSGDKDAIDAYRSGNRIESDIGKSRRSGDEAIAGAEAEAARTGRNDEEDKMLEAMDAKKGLEQAARDAGMTDYEIRHIDDNTAQKVRAGHAILPGEGWIKVTPKHLEDFRASAVKEKERFDVDKTKLDDAFAASPDKLPGLSHILGSDWAAGERGDGTRASYERAAYGALQHKYGFIKRTADRIERVLDRQKFDVPHEEAEETVKPRAINRAADIKDRAAKAVDVRETKLAEPGTVSEAAKRRKAEAEMLAGRKVAAKKEPEATTRTPLNLTAADKARMVADLEKAKAKRLRTDEDIASHELRVEPSVKRAAADLFEHFINDERGSAGKVNVDFKKMFNRIMRGLDYFDPTRAIDAMKRTEHTSYRARKVEGVRDAYTRSLDEKLHKTGKEGVNSFTSILNKARNEWRDIDPQMSERIFHARDADSASLPLPGKLPGKTNVESLPPKELDLYNKHLKPVFEENDKFFKAGQKLDEERYGDDVPHHIEHIQNGDTSKYNMLKTEDDPMKQGHYAGLSVSANAAKDRKYFVLERASDGHRSVVEPTDTGFVLHDNGKRLKINDPNGGLTFKDGDKYTVETKKGPVDYTMRHATVREKEANITINKKPIKYFKDARFSALISNAQLGAMARHLQVLHDFKNSKEWGDWTTTKASDPRVREDGWAKTTMPNFDGYYMHPDLKALFDDFAGEPENNYQTLNAAITKLIFVSPTAHLGNQGGHYVAGRGWDNLSIPKNLRVLSDLPMAVRSVLRQDAYQRALNRSGAGTLYGKVLTQDMPKQLAEAFKLEVDRDPSKWGKVADTFGVPLGDMVNSFYRASQKALWAGSDVFTTLRVRELQRKGIPMDQAVIEAERDLPNYRTPTKLMGSRWAAQKFFNSAMFAFSRYHFGMINAYANEFKDTFGKNSTMGDRVDGVGKLLAIGMMGMVMYPVLDKMAKAVTGNDDAEANRRGPTTIPAHIAGALQGREDIAAPVRAALTISPLLSTLQEALVNRDWRGKNIVEPGDVREAAVHGNVGGAARALTSEAEFLGRGLVAPFNMAASTYQKQSDGGLTGAAKAVGKTARDQVLDVKDVSDKSARYQQNIEKHQRQDLKTRFKRGGNGPFEGLMDSIFGR